jgi:hypothetical protein
VGTTIRSASAPSRINNVSGIWGEGQTLQWKAANVNKMRFVGSFRICRSLHGNYKLLFCKMSKRRSISFSVS